jgi:catechol 2,3-dioxygenase-like lactoylglutathione lyase family enzyme
MLRRGVIGGPWAALLLALLAAAAAQAGPVQAVDAVAITVSDMDRSLDFYTRVLPFEQVGDVEVTGEPYERLLGVFGLRLRVARLRLGDEHVELVQFLAPRGRPIPPDSRSNDRWFQHVAIIVRDMDAAYAHLRRHRVAHASPGPQRLPDWNPSAGGIEAFYFRDPDGNPLEVLAFPPGKGEPRWHRPDGPLFLGIDHTAIVVADTEASLALYRDRLGLQVVGTSENYGPEQERLNNVFGARLRITTLRAGSGPGVELLEYLSPPGGRPAPADTAANDLWHGHVVLRTPGVADAAGPLRSGHYGTAAGAPVALPGAELGYRHGLLARDPDGHGVLFVE